MVAPTVRLAPTLGREDNTSVIVPRKNYFQVAHHHDMKYTNVFKSHPPGVLFLKQAKYYPNEGCVKSVLFFVVVQTISVNSLKFNFALTHFPGIC
jgi:hypothetical protein